MPELVAGGGVETDMITTLKRQVLEQTENGGMCTICRQMDSFKLAS